MNGTLPPSTKDKAPIIRENLPQTKAYPITGYSPS